MNMQKTEYKRSNDTDHFKLGAASAKRLAAMSDVPAEQLKGLTIAEAAAKFRFEIDPMLFLFRRVCGEVVKTDPVTGIDYPVPFATVQVEDTDCSLLGYFPKAARWSWYFPFRCHREVIATTRTDACGKFCVWIPRWDIDWVLRFRRERHCFPVIFERPTLRELVDELILREPPRPGPDPGPLRVLDRTRLVASVEPSLGGEVAARLERVRSQVSFGASTVAAEAMLDAPVAIRGLQPPLSPELRKLRLPAAAAAERATAAEAVPPAAHTLASHLKLNAADLRGLDLRRYIGPFKRCVDLFVPEWAPIIDVPDITFRVLQDTDGDGDEEQIYGDSHFQVRWDANPIGPVTIHAGPNARAGVACGPTNIPCGNVPAIVMAGRLPVTGDPTVYDTAHGYALRTNRPHPTGSFADPLPNPDAASPLAGVLSLYGCNRTHPDATHYRLVYKHSSNDGATFSSFTPFVGLTWPLFRLSDAGVGEWHWPSSDAAGWYPIDLPPGRNPWLHQNLLLDWPTQRLGDGRYVVKMELRAGTTVLQTSDEVAFNVDNSAPHGPLTVEWSFSPTGPFQPIGGRCPVVRRHRSPADVYFLVTLDASARHLRSAELWPSDCGDGRFTFLSGSGGEQAPSDSTLYQYWHEGPADNSRLLRVLYKLPGGAAEGTYGFRANVSSRAFNPSGGDGGHLSVPAWQYDPAPIHIVPTMSFSVINAD